MARQELRCPIATYSHPRSLALRMASVRVRQLRLSSRRATCISTVRGLRFNLAAVSLSVSPAARRSRTSRWRRVRLTVWAAAVESSRASNGRASRRLAIYVASQRACQIIAASPLQPVRRHCIQAVSSGSLAFLNGDNHRARDTADCLDILNTIAEDNNNPESRATLQAQHADQRSSASRMKASA
jgi:hypothetical protein